MSVLLPWLLLLASALRSATAGASSASVRREHSMCRLVLRLEWEHSHAHICCSRCENRRAAEQPPCSHRREQAGLEQRCAEVYLSLFVACVCTVSCRCTVQ
jgi:hypothetical protein